MVAWMADCTAVINILGQLFFSMQAKNLLNRNVSQCRFIKVLTCATSTEAPSFSWKFGSLFKASRNFDSRCLTSSSVTKPVWKNEDPRIRRLNQQIWSGKFDAFMNYLFLSLQPSMLPLLQYSQHRRKTWRQCFFMRDISDILYNCLKGGR